MNSNLAMSGKLGANVIKAPGPGLAWKLRNTLRISFLWGLLTTWAAILFTKITGIPTLLGRLEARLIRADGSVINYGLLSCRVVTTAFVNFLAGQLQTDSTVIGDFKYHDSGVGTTAENVANTDMETTDGESRATGTQVASTNTYQSVGTISYTTTKAITEHGLFSASTGATLMDRSVFSAINVVSGDSIQFTYTLTISAGG